MKRLFTGCLLSAVNGGNDENNTDMPPQPRFLDSPMNYTYEEGDLARLECSLENLGTKKVCILGYKIAYNFECRELCFPEYKTTYILRYKIYTYSLVQSLEGFLFSLYWKTHRGLRTHSSTTGQTYTLTEIIMTNVLSHTYSQCHGDNNT